MKGGDYLHREETNPAAERLQHLPADADLFLCKVRQYLPGAALAA